MGGPNGHVLPGDMVVTHAAGYSLWSCQPGERDLDDDYEHVCQLPIDEPCLVLGMKTTVNGHMSPSFFVFAQDARKCGWLPNYAVRPLFTQREPTP